MNLTRRTVLTGAASAAACCTLDRLHAMPRATPELHEAAHYTRLESGAVRCSLCANHCVVPRGGRGLCRVRENRDGRYYSLVYGHPCAMNTDPIEKKPLFHVHPGARAFSIATVGCNLACTFCQNWDISQASPGDIRTEFVHPDRIARMAKENNAAFVAYTYNEPTIFFEYVIDCARAARAAGLQNVFISNGFIAKEPLAELCRHVTAIKIDLKAFTESFYTDVCRGHLQPVLDTLQRIRDAGVWLEIVILTIPSLNDDMDSIRHMTNWIVKTLGPDVPLHFTRFRPAYKLQNLPNTPIRTLEKARSAAMQEGCRYVYTGNTPGVEGESTFCPQCNKRVVSRYSYLIRDMAVKNGACASCGYTIPGVWAPPAE